MLRLTVGACICIVGSLAGCASSPALEPATSRSTVPEDINDRFLDPELDAAEWQQRWEVESREVWAERDAIVEAVGLRDGDRIADVGAGTGLFVEPFSSAVGSTGRVYAVEISPNFIAHLKSRAETEGLANVEVVLSTEESTTLPRRSIDSAFVCDTYHHFTYYEAMLRSLREAIRPGGRLVIVDFERIPGVSREWIFGHVRAGKETVIAEIEAAGFEYVDEVEHAGLVENYLIRFRRR